MIRSMVRRPVKRFLMVKFKALVTPGKKSSCESSFRITPGSNTNSSTKDRMVVWSRQWERCSFSIQDRVGTSAASLRVREEPVGRTCHFFLYFALCTFLRTYSHCLNNSFMVNTCTPLLFLSHGEVGNEEEVDDWLGRAASAASPSIPSMTIFK